MVREREASKTSRNQRGQAAVEFALTVVFLMILVVAFIELIMLFYTYNVLADSAKEGVRYAIVHGSRNGSPSGPTSGGGPITPPCTSANASTTNVTDVQNAVTTYTAMSLHDSTAMSINVCYFDGDNKAPHNVGVTVNYPYQPFFGLGWPTVTVNAAAQGRIMY